MGRLKTPDLPYVQATARGGRQRPNLIVLQSSFTPATHGAAKAVAMGMHRSSAQRSHHYVIDEATTLRLVEDNIVARHMQNSKGSIGIQICDNPSEPASRWDGRTHSMLLSRMADLVAQLCLVYGIKPRFLSDEELHKWTKWRLKRRGGIIVTGYMAQGEWPADYFLKLVAADIEKYKLLNDK